MTENCATVTRVLPVDPTSPGTIGGPHICCEIKLIDVPQMGYTALDKPNPRGEVCVRGSDCFTEYYHGTTLLFGIGTILIRDTHRSKEYEGDY
jgi:long-chain acyl-CoA synthetase